MMIVRDLNTVIARSEATKQSPHTIRLLRFARNDNFECYESNNLKKGEE